jgi:surface protein
MVLRRPIESALLSFVLVIGLMPSLAFAEEDGGAAAAAGADEQQAAADSESADASLASSDYIVDWTACGTCEWSIDNAGNLVVRPANGASEGTLDDWSESGAAPWDDCNFYPVADDYSTSCPGFIKSVKFEGIVHAVTAERMFSGCSSLSSADFSGLDTSNVSNMSSMFDNCSKIETLNLSVFDTSKTTNMSSMFSYCFSLTSLDISNFDTSNVTDMGDMFLECSSLKSLDVSGFDTPNVTNMASMFYLCSSLTSLDVSGFDTSNVTTMAAMFYGCSSLATLDVSGFDTSNVVGMGSMFGGCSSLKSLDLSNFKTSRVGSKGRDHMGWLYGSMSGMFADCTMLESLDLSNFDTSSVEAMEGMFSGCKSLRFLDLSSFDTSKVTNEVSTNQTDMKDTFKDCSSLRIIVLGEKFSFCGAGNARACDLPTPLGDGLTSGKWVSSVDGKAYAAYAIPNNVAATYTAEGYAIDISSAAVEVSGGPFIYSGKTIEPNIAVSLDGARLTEGTDYKVTFTNDINAGTATVIVEGIGGYSGYIMKSFQIEKANPSYAVPTGLTAIAGQTLADVVLPNGFTWQDASTTSVGAVGTNKFKVVYTPSDTANYNVVRDVEVAVAVRSGLTDISSGKLEVSGSAVYMGRAVEPDVTVAVGGKALAAGADYTVSYSGNEGFGTGRATVTGKGNYSGTLAADFSITSEVAKVFSDAPMDQWYVESGALDYAYAHGLISGYSGTNLVGAYDPIKRQDVAVILWRMAGEPEVAPGDGFEDVDYGDYYGPAVRWARSTGVINGYRDADGAYRTFGPSDLVTREQLAAMIANYAEKIGGMTVASDCSRLDALPDAGSVSDWARTSVGWCMDNDIMNGVRDDATGTAYAQPSGNAWRASMASMATVLHRDVLKLC